MTTRRRITAQLAPLSGPALHRPAGELTTTHVWSTEMSLLAEQLARAHCAQRLRSAEQERAAFRFARAARTTRRSERADARAARARELAQAATLALG